MNKLINEGRIYKTAEGLTKKQLNDGEIIAFCTLKKGINNFSNDFSTVQEITICLEANEDTLVYYNCEEKKEFHEMFNDYYFTNSKILNKYFSEESIKKCFI
jgi:hypothetical protein